MNRQKIVIEQRTTQKLGIFGLLTVLPTAAVFTFIMQGDTITWAQIERSLGKFAPDALAQVNHNCPPGWTNDPNCIVNVQDCDCPPPPPPPVSDCGDGDGSDCDSDSC